ncbi:uncharacterized protein LOC132736884, partial [Ruditapes philippinarum]|uniref:uncharacterized protein LOC132736884 n=1 Tax=Ruditapes philippinarum TaxID=129788 RepID=UPI00295B3FB4
MQQSSIGRQGQQNQGPNMNININNQTQPQRRPVGLTFPIQEGFQGGQARINDDTESDAGSLLYDNNFAGIQATPSFQQPALSENTRDHSLPSIFPVQSASGCSGVSMNIPSGGHLRPLQSYNEELVEPGVVVDLQRLRGMLKQRHGESKYHKDVQNCMRSFQQALFSEDDASQYAIQLLYYLGESGLKCLDCKEIHNIGTVFRHKESCSVHICFQEILNAVGNQDTRQSNGAITNDRDQISDQRPSVPSLVPYSIRGDSITMESMLPLERIELGQQEERVARGINDGATGGVSQAGAEETSYKAAILP